MSRDRAAAGRAAALPLRGSPVSQVWDSRAGAAMAATGGVLMLVLIPFVAAPLAMAVAGVGALLIALWALLIPIGAPAWVRAACSAASAPVVVLGTAAAEHGWDLSIGSAALVIPLLVVGLMRSGREVVGQLLWLETVYGAYLLLTQPVHAVVLGLVVSTTVLALVAACVHWLRTLVDETVLSLHRQAARDPLTGLLNRRGFTEAVAAAGPVGVLLLDVDHFKRINDTFGHGAGDEVLHELGAVLEAGARPGEVPARLGGEEFVLAVPLDARGRPGDELGTVRVRAEELRGAVAAAFRDRPAAVTVSVGAAVAPAGDLSGLLSAADAALYRAKRAGRNRVEVAAGVEAVPAPRAG
ncbi:diguanylate cyclase (GGDEF)-like protein [Kineococcus xinjiangensis]|uniref:Diguanylate cyclase (GGDEF)-like protein n=1 Tax=Kineococcus xinjiangensis TaxID=512762 RepID=A0A2S6IUW7_9ACTN|nr:GGDEF domain-containing protein [Kineococcus xinjiangensis]PPK98072.1 diguanylate cyclase (GGDEF)-like protein [Kineococcus xinjiangensis]